MRPGKIGAAIAVLALASGAAAQPSPTPSTVEPLIECKVTGDAGKRLLSVDIAWPSGLKPRFPRDDSGIIAGRAIAPAAATRTPPVSIEDNPEWASACEREGCRLTYSVDIGKGIATDKRGDWGFEEKQRIVMAPLVRWLVRPEDRRARGRLRIDFQGGKNFELVSGVMDGRVNHIDTDLVVMDGPDVVPREFTHRSMDVPGCRRCVARARRTVR